MNSENGNDPQGTTLIYGSAKKNEFGIAAQVLRRFPATILLGGQYILFALLPAIIRQNPALKEIALIVGVATLTALVFEVAVSLVGSTKNSAPEEKSRQRNAWKNSGNAGALIVWSVGLAATVLQLAGGSNYFTQVGGSGVAAWAPLVTPFVPWFTLGVCLMANQVLVDRTSRAWTYVLLSISVAAVVLFAVRAGMINHTVSTLAGIALALFFAGLLRPTLLVGLVLAGLASWPILADARNEVRAEVAVGQYATETPYERLALDRQMQVVEYLRESSEIQELHNVPLHVRTGLLPSIIDGNRPPLDTGTQFSVALGGSANNSTSATALGNVYIFGGMLGVVAYTIVVAVAFRAFLSIKNGFGLAGVALTYSYLVSFAAAYPSSIAQALQTLVSFAAAALVVRSLGARRGRGED